MSNQLKRLTVKPKQGNEQFKTDGQPLDYTLVEFWRWSVSDLVSNATRGILAEFIVAKALISPTDTVRDEWGAFDLITPAGVKVEVKSAGYIQSWSQKRYSTIQFRTPKTKAWDPNTNQMISVSKRQADVYVFAMLAHKEKATVDPMDVAQWQFYVLPTSVLNQRTRSQHSITLKSLEGLAGSPVDYGRLAAAVAKAAGNNSTT